MVEIIKVIISTPEGAWGLAIIFSVIWPFYKGYQLAFDRRMEGMLYFSGFLFGLVAAVYIYVVIGVGAAILAFIIGAVAGAPIGVFFYYVFRCGPLHALEEHIFPMLIWLLAWGIVISIPVFLIWGIVHFWDS
ncbi:hypothetical protein FM037_02915 [Shewanella psychropiezotolerans]|uniref:Uncharacterized protein n=1 Tax=Shewanella psychropiezotolerans TaxID=2593655 RepID=A0ABX5WVI3_9GAMM|nr:hypothetical protein [Shewanella psychropiezotolerans]QDO82382.1 hypothetical protein FM037_02915 [Shewanella psychropiezotolerans]